MKPWERFWIGSALASLSLLIPADSLKHVIDGIAAAITGFALMTKSIMIWWKEKPNGM